MRIVEAYIGEYASGKSENAVARAVELAALGRKATIVDLDLVEPCYTLRPLIDYLEKKQVEVLAWKPEQSFGVGEAGQILFPAARWALRRAGDIIFDVGYGAGGASVLNLIEGVYSDPDLRIVLVTNFSRPLVNTKERMLEYLAGLGQIDGLIANTHLGEETNREVVLEGLALTKEIASGKGLPIDAVALSRLFYTKNPDFLTSSEYLKIGAAYPVRVLEDILGQGFW